MLRVENLTATLGRAGILRGLDLEVNAGEVVALLGRNGAGKSTTLRTIMGLTANRAGRVLFQGRDISRLPTHRIARLGMGYVPEDRRLFSSLSVRENLEAGRREPPPGYRGEAWTPERLFELFPNLAGLGARRAGKISGGEQQMLAIARTLMGNPVMMLLDEPSEGLAPLIVEQMARVIRAMQSAGVAVLLCEQNLRFARAVASRAYVIQQGLISRQGEVESFFNENSANDFLT
ncbi:MAG: ABC transporter ATP-binding protein [Deltaproteobacteria bacterium]|nr:ABC transporter ATP-binding protein [Deltaproteobacteria bacterium]